MAGDGPAAGRGVEGDGDDELDAWMGWTHSNFRPLRSPSETSFSQSVFRHPDIQFIRVPTMQGKNTR